MGENNGDILLHVIFLITKNLYPRRPHDASQRVRNRRQRCDMMSFFLVRVEILSESDGIVVGCGCWLPWIGRGGWQMAKREKVNSRKSFDTFQMFTLV